jgi:general secretion pathway protein F
MKTGLPIAVLAWSVGVLMSAIPVGIVVFLAVEMLRRRRESRQHAMLWLLSASTERSIPLGSAVAALAKERGRLLGARAGRLARLLESGVPLPDALEKTGGLVPAYAMPMIRVGYQSGSLSPALRQAAMVADLHEPTRMSLLGAIGYAFLSSVYALGILTYIVCKLLPEYEKIAKGNGATLPLGTRWLLAVSSFLRQQGIPVSVVLALGTLLMFYVIARHLGWTRWDFPGMSRFVRRLHWANILDSLALVARQQQPLLGGIVAIAQSYPKASIRRRLRGVAEDVRDGRDWADSLHARGLMGRADVAVLRAAQRAGNLPWAMNELAASNRRRFNYHLQALVQTAYPSVVIFFGVIVLFLVLSLFVPLVSLIELLSTR